VRHAPTPSPLQYCKLRVEEELRALAAAGRLSHAILRPTAYFKSVCNQFEKVAAGGSFVYFDLGFGRCIRANPISERDLAAALIDAIADRARENAVWQIGGPDAPLSKLEQGALMAAAAGLAPPKAVAVPIGLLNGIVALLELLARLTRLEALEDAAEVSRILRYYASEDMVALADGEVYGADTVADFYKTVALHGREYDPYVAIFDSREAVEGFGAKTLPVRAARVGGQGVRAADVERRS
jgi:divinyl chlorophyllide a 8-vinyl-reductase